MLMLDQVFSIKININMAHRIHSGNRWSYGPRLVGNFKIIIIVGLLILC
jgi:hypothetical protein